MRPDGRGLLKFRPAIVNVGSVKTADGSSLVKIGNTTVVCGIKAELAMPKAEKPKHGFLIPNVTLPPLCSSKIRPGPPGDEAQVMTHLVADTFVNSGCLDLSDLCVEPERLVWVLHCDMVCLDHDGGLFDACVISLVAALKTVRLPKVEYTMAKTTVLLEDRSPLNVCNVVIPSTFAIFDETMLKVTIADPTSEEEHLCAGILSVVINGDSTLSSVLKPGGVPLQDAQLSECISAAKKRALLIRKLVETALNAPEC